MWRKLKEKKKIHIHYNDLYEIYYFGTPFLGQHYDTLSLFDLCLGEEKKIAKETNSVSLYDLYDHALAQEPLPQGSWNLQFW